MPRKLGAPDEAYELQVHQRLEVCRDVDAAYVLYLALRERLPVGYDGEGLEGGPPEPVGSVEVKKRPYIPPAARRRLDAVRPCGADEPEPHAGNLKGLFKATEGRLDLLRRARAVDVHYLRVFAFRRIHGAHGLAYLRGGERRLACEKQRAHNLLQGARQWNLDFVTHSRLASPGAGRLAAPSTEGS